MKTMKKKKIIFIDLPQLAHGIRFDFYEIFVNLGREFDELRIYARIPREPEAGGKDTWGLIRVAVNSGGFVTLYPSDVDGFIVEDIRKTLERKEVGEIAILAGDSGYYEVLRVAKRAGLKVKVILPPESNSYLLRSLADEIKTIADYAKEYAPETPETKSNVYQIVARNERSETNMVMVTGGR